jgi:hypothetical protein
VDTRQKGARGDLEYPQGRYDSAVGHEEVEGGDAQNNQNGDQGIIFFPQARPEEKKEKLYNSENRVGVEKQSGYDEEPCDTKGAAGKKPPAAFLPAQPEIFPGAKLTVLQRTWLAFQPRPEAESSPRDEGRIPLGSVGKIFAEKPQGDTGDQGLTEDLDPHQQYKGRQGENIQGQHEGKIRDADPYKRKRLGDHVFDGGKKQTEGPQKRSDPPVRDALYLTRLCSIGGSIVIRTFYYYKYLIEKTSYPLAVRINVSRCNTGLIGAG